MKVLSQCQPPERVTVDANNVPDVLKIAVQTPTSLLALQVPVPQQQQPDQQQPDSRVEAQNRTDDEKPAYKPTKRDWDYLNAVQQLTKDGVVVADRKLAETMKVTHGRIAQFRMKPGFREWLRAQLMGDIDDEWALMVKTAARLAMKGSIDHLNFIAKIRGEFKGEGTGPGSGDHGLHVHLHV